MAQLTDNQEILENSQERNYSQPQVLITGAGQTIDIELESLAGYMESIDLIVQVDLAITVAGGGQAPTRSPFAPWNIFSSIEFSLGGGTFQKVNPFFYALREMITHQGWTPALSAVAEGYSTTTHFNYPAVNAPAGATTNNVWFFPIRIPLQAIPKQIFGIIPAGTSAVKPKLRLTVSNTLYGTDQYVSALFGGAGVSVAVGASVPSYIAPQINYKMPYKTGIKPAINYVFNVQERAVSLTGAGSLNPLKFADPFHYMRLWAVVIDGTGAPNTTGVTAWELDPMPGFARKNFNNFNALAQYFNGVRRLYQTDLPTGVFVHDLMSGFDPVTQEGTQAIDGSLYQTMQAQLAVGPAVNVNAPARIITYAETLSPVQF